jgi:hypothetical protein
MKENKSCNIHRITVCDCVIEEYKRLKRLEENIDNKIKELTKLIECAELHKLCELEPQLKLLEGLCE